MVRFALKPQVPFDGSNESVWNGVVRDQRVDLRADGVHLEPERVPPVVEGVDHNLDAVVRLKVRVAPHLGPDDSLRIVVEATNADVERRRVVEDPNLGLLRRNAALDRIYLRELTDRVRERPHVVVEPPVDYRRLLDADGLDRRSGRGGLECAGRRERENRHLGRASYDMRGMRIVNVLPRPIADSRSSRPPCRSTAHRAIGRPSPAPPVERERSLSMR